MGRRHLTTVSTLMDLSLEVPFIRDLAICGFYLVTLFSPGYALSLLIPIHRHRFLFSYCFSFSLLVLVHYLSTFLDKDISIVGTYLGIFVIAACLILIVTLKTLTWHKPAITDPPKTSAFVVAVLLATFSSYHFFVGPYTEIPSDFWEHLARVTQLLQANSPADFGLTHNLIIPLAGGNFVYYMHASTSLIFDVSPLYLSRGATLATSLVFLGSVYFFSLFLVEQTSFTPKKKYATAILATIFTFLTFGTATFSYLRYYSFFPTIFAFPLVFGSVILFMEYLSKKSFPLRYLAAFPFLLASMLLTHKQEGMFSVILVVGLISFNFVRTFRARFSEHSLHNRARWLFLSSAILIALVLSYVLFTRPMSNWGYTPHMLNLGDLNSRFNNIPIVNPGFRFWDTLGFFGLFVYLTYFINIRFFRNFDYVNFAMMIPVFTIFNPLYSIIFLHIADSSVLWRVSYLMPLPFVASFLIVSLFPKESGKPRSSYIPTTAWLLLFALSIMPFKFFDTHNRTSRIPSLLPVDLVAGQGLWDDLIKEVVQISSEMTVRNIITDSTTRFVLYSTVRGQAHRDSSYFPINNFSYRRDFRESDFSKHLLIINRRDGLITGSAHFSGHWPRDVLLVSNQYPAEIDIFIEENADRFSLIWEADQIRIFRVNY